MDATDKLLVQHKQGLIKAIKARQYTAAASILQLALALCPGDNLLTELAATVHAKVQQDDRKCNSSDEASEDGDADEGTSYQAYELHHSAGKSASEESSSESEDDEETSSSSSGSGSNGFLQLEDDSIAAAPPAQAVQTRDACEGAADTCYVQLLHHNLSRMTVTQHHHGRVSGIQLAAGCCTLTPQRRAEIRQQLAAANEQQKMAALQSRLVADDPLLAAL